MCESVLRGLGAGKGCSRLLQDIHMAPLNFALMHVGFAMVLLLWSSFSIFLCEPELEIHASEIINLVP